MNPDTSKYNHGPKDTRLNIVFRRPMINIGAFLKRLVFLDLVITGCNPRGPSELLSLMCFGQIVAGRACVN